MKNRVFILGLSAGFLLWASLLSAGDMLDRIVAKVNGHIILQSDWDDAARYEAFIDGRPLDKLTNEDRKAALDRLIDQELLREQMNAADTTHATGEEVARRLQEIRKQYPKAESEQGWQQALVNFSLTENELKKRVALQLDLLRLVDAKLRPSVQIDSKSIESYYNQELLPQLRQSGSQPVTLAEVTPKIKELLTQQKLNQLLTAWLHNLRAGSEIRLETIPSDAGDRTQ